MSDSLQVTELVSVELKLPSPGAPTSPHCLPNACQKGRCDLPRHREEFQANLKTTKIIKKGETVLLWPWPDFIVFEVPVNVVPGHFNQLG